MSAKFTIPHKTTKIWQTKQSILIVRIATSKNEKERRRKIIALHFKWQNSAELITFFDRAKTNKHTQYTRSALYLLMVIECNIFIVYFSCVVFIQRYQWAIWEWWVHERDFYHMEYSIRLYLSLSLSLRLDVHSVYYYYISMDLSILDEKGKK